MMTIPRRLTIAAAALLAAATLVFGVSVPHASAVPESFEVVFGQLVFQNAATRNAAQTRITNTLGNRPRFQDTEWTVTPVAAGKYGAGPALMVTLRMTSRADADALWSDITQVTALSTLRATSMLLQSSVQFDAELGTQTVTQIHQLTVPAAPGDF